MNVRDFKQAVHDIVKHAHPEARQIIIQVYANELMRQVEIEVLVYLNQTLVTVGAEPDHKIEIESDSMAGCLTLLIESVKTSNTRVFNSND